VNVYKGCGALINMGVAHQGHLRRKRAIHSIADKLRIGSLASGLFSCMYWLTCWNFCLCCFNSESVHIRYLLASIISCL